MTIRSKSYLVLIPAILILCLSYLAVMLAFNRRDAYRSQNELIQDRANTIHSFIVSFNPNSTQDVIHYLEKALRHIDTHQAQKLPVRLRLLDSETQEEQFVFSNPEVNENQDATTENVVLSKLALTLPGLEHHLELEFTDKDPTRVFFEKEFWLQIALVTLLLLLLGVGITETLVRILSRDVKLLERSLQTTPKDHRSSKHRDHKTHEPRIQELEELSITYEILKDSNKANRDTENFLNQETHPILRQEDYHVWVKQHSKNDAEITSDNLCFQIYQHQTPASHQISLLYTKASVVFACIGWLKKPIRDFEKHIKQQILADLFTHSPDDTTEFFERTLRHLDDYEKLSIHEFIPERKEMNVYLLENGKQLPSQCFDFDPHIKQCIPIGFEIPQGISQKIIGSQNWIQLFSQILNPSDRQSLLFVFPKNDGMASD